MKLQINRCSTLLFTCVLAAGCSQEKGDPTQAQENNPPAQAVGGQVDSHAGHDHANDSVPDDGHGPGATDDHAGEADEHAEGDHIELTQRQFESANLKIVEAGPGTVSDSFVLAGSVAPNADSVTHVTPRVAGQVGEVYKQLGESVVEGELLCVIDSVELGDAVAEYLRDEARVESAKTTLKRERELFEGRRLALLAIVDGAIEVQERICLREKELQEKAVSTVRPLLEAQAALQLAKLDKAKKLGELQAERDTRLLKLEVDQQSVSIEFTAARNRLRAMGIEDQELDKLSLDSPLLVGEYKVISRGTGIVVLRHVSTGEYVSAGSKLYVIEDLSDVWFVASAFEEQLQSLRTNQLAMVQLDAFPDTLLEGHVSFLDYHVDPATRTVGVRIALDNKVLASWPEEYPLRPGMFGRADLYSESRQVRVVLPESALVHDDHGDSVFVQVEPLGFEERQVVAVHAAGGLVEIQSGIEPGERVVTEGTFLLKSAARLGELGGGHSH